MVDLPGVALAVFAALAVGAIAGAEGRARRLHAVCKPVATLALLPVVGMPPAGSLSQAVAVGLLLSAAGDAALLGEGTRAFLAGLILFLLAHVAYVVALAPRVAGVGIVVAAAGAVAVLSAFYVRALWRGAGGMRGPIVVYASVITAMAATALAAAAPGGGLPGASAPLAALGALLFYASDANLGWRRFRGDYRHGHTVTLILYWAGQLGLALAARWAA